MQVCLWYSKMNVIKMAALWNKREKKNGNWAPKANTSNANSRVYMESNSNKQQHPAWFAAYHSSSESIFQRVNNRRLIHVSLFSRLFLFGRGLFKQNQNKLITLCYSQIPFWIRSIEHCQSQNSSLRWINVRCIWLVIRFGEAFFWPHLSIWTDCVVCCSVFFPEIFEL